MILAKCIFSQSATGELSSAYFRKLADISGWGVQIFANARAPNRDERLKGEEEGDEEERRRKRRRNTIILIAAATKFPM